MGEAMDGAMQQAPQPERQSERQSIGGGECAAAMAGIRFETVGKQRVGKVE